MSNCFFVWRSNCVVPSSACKLMSMPICLSSLCMTTATALPMESPEIVRKETLKPFGYLDAFIGEFDLAGLSGWRYLLQWKFDAGSNGGVGAGARPQCA